MNQQDIVTKRFEGNSKEYALDYGNLTSTGYSFRARKERLLELLGNGSGRLLDIGCGPGVMTKEIMEAGWQYEGVDIAENMIAEARRRAPEGIFRVERVEHVQAQNNSYDAIVAMGLIEYLDDEKVALKELHRVLSQNGRVFISVPNVFSPMRMWDRYIIRPLSRLINLLRKRKYDGVYHREYSSKGYNDFLRRNGFTPLRTAYYNFRILPRPLDYWFPRIAVYTARIFESLRNTPFKFFGTGFIVEAKKN